MNDANDQALILPQPELGWRWVHIDGVVWFSVIDVIKDLTESPDPSNYWRQMKLQARRKEPELAQFIHDNIRTEPLIAYDGKLRKTDVATIEMLLRLVQSIPSKNAEPIKRELAALGAQKYEELQQISPVDLKRAEYRKQGYDEPWIDTRISYLLARNEITETWVERGATPGDIPILTNTLTERSYGITVNAYKRYKHISPKASLQDNQTHQELALGVIGYTTAQGFHEDRDSQGIIELSRDVRDAGDLTAEVRKLIEERTGRPVVSPLNAKDLRGLPADKQERKELPPSKQEPEQKTLF